MRLFIVLFSFCKYIQFCFGGLSCFFFFKQKTADEMLISDWSSDVCSSDLAGIDGRIQGRAVVRPDDVAAGATVLLTDKERVVLDVLAERPGVVWSRQDLLARVWDGRESDPHVVEVTVGRLRPLGRASCRDGGCPYVYIWVVSGTLKK